MSIIEPYIDENVTWSGGVPHLIKGEYYALVTVDGEQLLSIPREQLISLYRSKWVTSEVVKNGKMLKDAIFHQLFKERIEERDRKIKAMSVDELIENLQDENGYGKSTLFI